MKLLFCEFCFDIFKLEQKLRQCKCGRVRGKYLKDGHRAVINGKGRSLAIGNGSLIKALQGHAQYPYKDKITFLAWERPHSGEQNPRTTIDENL